jgi:hypothetical protein
MNITVVTNHGLVRSLQPCNNYVKSTAPGDVITKVADVTTIDCDATKDPSNVGTTQIIMTSSSPLDQCNSLLIQQQSKLTVQTQVILFLTSLSTAQLADRSTPLLPVPPWLTRGRHWLGYELARFSGRNATSVLVATIHLTRVLNLYLLQSSQLIQSSISAHRWPEVDRRQIGVLRQLP